MFVYGGIACEYRSRKRIDDWRHDADDADDDNDDNDDNDDDADDNNDEVGYVDAIRNTVRSRGDNDLYVLLSAEPTSRVTSVVLVSDECDDDDADDDDDDDRQHDVDDCIADDRRADDAVELDQDDALNADDAPTIRRSAAAAS